MPELINVVFYYGVREQDALLDHLVQSEPPAHWSPAIADFNLNKNLRDLMEMANISPSDWKSYLIEEYGFDPLHPTVEALIATGVPQDRVEFAMEEALRLSEDWNDPETYLWKHDDTAISNLLDFQLFEVIRESRGRGIPVIAFRAPEDQVKNALSADNVVMVSSDVGIYVGLVDPVNGYGWSPQDVCDPVVFRPALEGRVHIVGTDHPIFESVMPSAYTAFIGSTPGEPVLVSSRKTDVARLAPPSVVDERNLTAAFGP